MVDKITEIEILKLLITSDFSDEISNEELIFLIKKFRNYYRILHDKYETMKKNNEVTDMRESSNSDLINSLIEKIDILEKKKISLSTKVLNERIKFLEKELIGRKLEIKEIEDKNRKLLNRKLTLKERIEGNINEKKSD